jgi:hypothetical protein
MRHRILFLAANPAGLTARKLDVKAHEIQKEIEFASARDRFEFVPLLAAQPIDLLRALRRIEPSIVQDLSAHEATRRPLPPSTRACWACSETP